MSVSTEFVSLALEDLRREAAMLKADGWRFVQTHAVNTEDGIDLYYSFMKDGGIVNYRISGVAPDQTVPSITDLFLAAFVFENEARELFGVNMVDIAIDFQGAMYAPHDEAPMTFVSPEQKAAREKARKVAAAKAAKEAAKASEAPAEGATAAPKPSGKRVFVMTPELQARLDAKMPSLSDEKKAKVEAALKARAEEAAGAAQQPPANPEPATAASSTPKPAEEKPKAAEPAAPAQPEVDTALEAALSGLDDQKAAKVRAILEGKPTEPASASSAEPAQAGAFADEQVAKLLGVMDEEKASKIMRALSSKEGE